MYKQKKNKMRLDFKLKSECNCRRSVTANHLMIVECYIQTSICLKIVWQTSASL